eukprot:1028196-Pleurochrysis_carterae.AAC.3
MPALRVTVELGQPAQEPAPLAQPKLRQAPSQSTLILARRHSHLPWLIAQHAGAGDCKHLASAAARRQSPRQSCGRPTAETITRHELERSRE